MYEKCQLCPRNCGVNRLAGEIGYCGETSALRLGFAGIHRGEEPPLVGTGGSGTIFISGCNLGCSFCQNYQISQGTDKVQTSASQGTATPLGRQVSPQEFAKICKLLLTKGAENINIVTGSHAVPAIIEGIICARKAGVTLPVLWNSSGYESIAALELLQNYVDIFLPDLKTMDSQTAAKYFNAPDYPEIAAEAILKMIELKQGNKEKIIIRHLILPGYLESTREVLRWFADNAQAKAQLSLMSQYTPIPNRTRNEIAKPMPNRFLQKEEYDTVLSWLNDFGIEDGFCQEFVTGNEWLPDFNRTNPFSSELSEPIWHFKTDYATSRI